MERIKIEDLPVATTVDDAENVYGGCFPARRARATVSWSSFSWAQIQGPAVVLSNPFSAVTTFVSPALQAGGRLPYSFSLFVDDGGSARRKR